MKHRVSVVCMLACALCLALGLAGCSQSGSYEGKTLTPTVSAPTIGTNGTLRVGIDADGGAPFITSKSSAQYAGLDVDMAAALADQLGLKLELVDVAGNAAKALSDGDVDIVMGQSSSEKSTSMWMSDPYLETGVALFASGSNSVPTQAAAGSIAAQSSSTSAWAVENAFGDEALNPSSDLVSAFSLIETGKATYVAADAVIGSYAALRQNVDVKPIALLGSKGGYCIGASSSNQKLQKAISCARSGSARPSIWIPSRQSKCLPASRLRRTPFLANRARPARARRLQLPKPPPRLRRGPTPSSRTRRRARTKALPCPRRRRAIPTTLKIFLPCQPCKR